METRRIQIKHLSRLAWAGLPLLLSGCFIKGHIMNLDGALSLSGSVLGVTVNSASISSTSSCTPKVFLYALDSHGAKLTPALADTSLNSDGRFVFSSLDGIYDTDLADLHYLLSADPCDGSGMTLARFVSGMTAQDISYGSTLLSYIPDVKQVAANDLSQVPVTSADQVQSLLNQLSTTDIAGSYQAGLNNPQTVSRFQSTFGFPFSELQYSLPTIDSVVHVNSVNELQTAALSVSATHWDPNITLAYIWKINGVVKSTTSNLNWTPGKNSQGNDTVDLYVGIDTAGDGSLDISKSFSHFTYPLIVNNTYPPVPPALSLSSAAVTNSLTASLSLATGAGRVNCQSFSKLIFTESDTSAVLSQPSSSDFDSPDVFDCSSAGTQSSVFTMSMYDGNHTIALWAEDAASNITLLSDASSVNVTVDQTAPVVSSLILPSLLTGGTAISVPFSAVDATSGLASLILSYSDDGGLTFSPLADLTAAASPYSWTVPATDTSDGVLQLVATDNAGNVTTVDSNTFTIDSTAPAALTLAFTTPADFTTTSAGLLLSKQAGHSITLSDCSGDAVKMFFKESDTTEGVTPATPATPASTDVGWASCDSLTSWTAVAGDGEKTYFAWAMDAAGNVSAASNALTFVLDQTSPTLSLTSWNSSHLQVAAGSSQVITWNASDAHLSASPVKIEYTLDGSTWTALTSSAANASNSGCTVPSGSSGCYPWTVPTLDSGGNALDTDSAQVRVTVTDTTDNPATSAVGVAFQIRSTGPVLSSTTINDGAQYAGTTLVNLKVALADHGFSTVGIKVALGQAVSSTSDCTLPANPVWVSWSGDSANLPYQMSIVGGLKKICAWARNTAGFMSSTSTFTCTTGVDCNLIELQTGNPPIITTFTVNSSGGFSAPVGADIEVGWAAQSQGSLKLDNNPIEIAYTTDNANWFDVITGLNITTAGAMTWQGGLSGNPISGSGTLHFASPSSNFTRLRAVARDIAGNYSIVAYSNIFNTTVAGKGTWQIYAGSTNRGDGGSGTSTSLQAGLGAAIAVDPMTGDIYARDTGTPAGLRKLDVKTGLVSTFIPNGTTNLSITGGAITSSTRIAVGDTTRILFGPDGSLYAAINGSIVKIDVHNMTSTLYLGGGTGHDSNSDPTSVSVDSYSPMAFDEDMSLYFLSDCLSDTSPNVTYNPQRLMKAARNADGTAGAITSVAGSCAYGSLSPSGTAALSASFGPSSSSGKWYVSLASIVALNHGKTIYLGAGGGSSPVFKLIDDDSGNGLRLYRTSLSPSYAININLNPVDGMIYMAMAGDYVGKFPPLNTAADGGESVTTLTGGSANVSAHCMDDGIDAMSACLKVDTQFAFDSSGTVYFTDGIGHNSSGGYRVRYLDSSGKVSTIFGSLPFYGNGLQKELIKGLIGGIYYKKSSSGPANAAAFPNGLYLVSPSMVFGYVDPGTGIYNTLWGTQLNAAVSMSDIVGTVASSEVSMGNVYSSGNGYPLTFDNNGLPWMRLQNEVVTLDNDKIIRQQMTGTTGLWANAAESTDPSIMSLYVDGGMQNFTLMGNALFLIGGYYSPPGYSAVVPQIRLLDFDNHVSPIVLGGSYDVSLGMTTPTSVAAGDGTTTPVKNSPLSSYCINAASCFIQYSGDSLYFTDGTSMIHVLAHPEDPHLSSLSVLAIPSTHTITSFTVKDDGSQIFYYSNSNLYCYPLTAAGVKSWCSSSSQVGLYSYSSQLGSLGNRANAFTWMDDGNLLISTGNVILQYTLPADP